MFHPSIAQLAERWTVVVKVIHRSLVQIRLDGNPFLKSDHMEKNDII